MRSDSLAISKVLLGQRKKIQKKKKKENPPFFPRSLTSLSLSHMSKLTQINAGAFGTLPKLQDLIVQNNRRLGFLHPDAFDRIYPENFELKNLHLRGNDLKYLPQARQKKIMSSNHILRLKVKGTCFQSSRSITIANVMLAPVRQA